MRDVARKVWRFFARRAGAFPYVIVSAVFILSRLFYRIHFALTFDWTPITYFIQYIPLWIMKHDFWRSILYLHQQAPFQNLLAGGIWVTFGPERGALILDAIYVTFGYTFAMSFLTSMRRLGVGPILATIFVSIYTASPVVVLYEMWLFYHEPVVTCFALALLGLLRFYERATYRRGLFFFSMLAVAALFRSVYQPIWMIGILVALLLCPPRPESLVDAVKTPLPWWRRWLFTPSTRRTLVAAAIGPIAIVAGNGLKTSILLPGREYSSAAIWANVPHKIWDYLPSIEKKRLQDEGLVSDALDHEAFCNLETLPKLRVPHPDTGVPLLDMAMTPDHEANQHTLEYLLIVDKYMKPDGKYLVAHYPWVYVESVVDALSDWYCSTPTRDLVMWRARNTKQLGKIEDALEGKESRSRYTLPLRIGLPVCFIYCILRLFRPKARSESERSRTAATLFMLVTIVYAGLGTTMISSADFSRYRFDVDPFYWTLFAWLLTDLGRGVVRALRSAFAFIRAKIRRLIPKEVQSA